MRSLKAIERADVVLILINAEEGIIEQDKHIAGYSHEAGKASIFVVNKWDAVDKDDKSMQHFTQNIRDHFLFMSYAPIAFLSALTKSRLHKLLPVINHVSEQHSCAFRPIFSMTSFPMRSRSTLLLRTRAAVCASITSRK